MVKTMEGQTLIEALVGSQVDEGWGMAQPGWAIRGVSKYWPTPSKDALIERVTEVPPGAFVTHEMALELGRVS